MRNGYIFEPTLIEIAITELFGNTLAKSYFRALVEGLEIDAEGKALDYCSESGHCVLIFYHHKIGLAKIITH